MGKWLVVGVWIYILLSFASASVIGHYFASVGIYGREHKLDEHLYVLLLVDFPLAVLTLHGAARLSP